MCVVTTSYGNLLANTIGGDIDVEIKSEYNCDEYNKTKKSWLGVSVYYTGHNYQTCWKNGPNEWQLCYSNSAGYELCQPKGGHWQPISFRRKTERDLCGTQCTSFI